MQRRQIRALVDNALLDDWCDFPEDTDIRSVGAEYMAGVNDYNAAWRQAVATRLIVLSTATPSGAANGESSTKQFCISTFTSAVFSGTTAKSNMNFSVLCKLLALWSLVDMVTFCP